MALQASGLKSAIMSATAGLTDSAVAQTALGNAIASYILSNAEISYSWMGAILPSPPNTPDPVTTAKGEFLTLVISCTPSGADNPADALSHLKSQIQAGFAGATHAITDPGFVVSPGAVGAVSSPSVSVPVTNDRDAAMDGLAGSIIDWVKTLVPIGTCAGSHLPYTGGVGTPLSVA